MRRAWVATLLACRGPLSDPESFAREFAARWCERQEECAPDDFDLAYDRRADCRDDPAAGRGVPRADESCDLDPDGAAACLRYLRTTDCGGCWVQPN